MTLKSTDNSADTFLILIVPVALVIMFLFLTWPLLLALAIGILLWNILERYRWQKWSRSINPTFHRLIQENQGRITVIDLALKANLSAPKAKQYLDNKASEFGARVLEEPKDGIDAYFFVTAKTLGSIFDESEPPLSLPEFQTETVSADDVQESLEVSSQLEPIATLTPEDNTVSSESEMIAASTSEDVEQLPDLVQHTTANVPETRDPTESQLQEHAALASLLQSELAKRLDVNSSTIYKHRSNSDFAEWSQSRDPEGVAWQYSEEDKRFFPIPTQS